LVPQLLGQAGFVDELAEVADALAVPFIEIVVETTLDTAIARYQARAAAAAPDLQVADPAEDPRRVIPRYAAAIETVVAGRPHTARISNNDGEDGDVDLLAILNVLSR
jgi:hypothetical protein